MQNSMLLSLVRFLFDLQTECNADVFTGAGIGGLALAMALHKKGISFTLYEDAKEFSAVG